ncbi:GGDEF domain-containing protein [Aliarcobacter cryaerophilus]|uniref:GGDEF domain-containing protein n=1 Tax=Aliarcobacter cryaerophilus TaxID=28198 RepID=UPI0021B26BB3|nr:GGDEF domain-containing protein [Aliarcobacter cryaerophilus]MCT7469597.1 GGDEF domain-containing protein [Aliarcobacter cryaerophilus]MCT7481984.1 GGDEF domain-containing protein [Aliarcobacter cryaerophilus]MCT7500449.1 GGDEF domain-containing protein [Aliarcobacter cryaerophilus]MCT7508427.1 GGDEF domain-containing protein [Aliarcobacter cryaerophilus]MCT7513637.1 GGDEF domain-containing protein [Aliarcobacter cryaerophilus]
MKSNTKITLIIFSMVLLLTSIIVVLVAIGSRQVGYDAVKKKAYLTADIVKNSLTSHMVNGNMAQRDVFLDSISQLKNVQSLWLVRAKSVSEQFGNSNLANEKPKDEIDLQVLNTGIEKIVIEESLYTANLRITIPYTASSLDRPNCLNCHNAKEGEVLGAISLSFDISEDRGSNIMVLIYIIGTISIFLIVFLIFMRKKITPYTNSFDSLSDVLKKVHEGDYSIRANPGVLKEDKEVSNWLNELIEKLETVLTGIEKNLTSFVHNRTSNVNHDKLITAKEIIEDISEIYHYKKTIENDLTIDDIYHRLILVLKDKLEINCFVIFETDLLKDERKTIFASNDAIACCDLKQNIKEACRAERINSIVSSENFPEICRVAKCKVDENYICIPFYVNEQKNIVIHIISKSQDELNNLKYKIGIIKKYLEETKPILESKILMEALRQKNLTDSLTGLYNRKYLDEIVEKQLNLDMKNGVVYAIMFLDIDYFKMVNDTYGHDVGDDILRKLAITMKKSISSNETLIRYGGEEFLILMKNATQESAKELANKINADFSKIIFNYGGDSFSKTVSIGYSFFPTDTDQFWKCIKYADISLYEAKSTGRNKVIKFSKDILKNGDKIDY